MENTEGCAIRAKNGELIEIWLSSEKSAREECVLTKLKTLTERCKKSSDFDENLRNANKYFCLRLQTYWKNCQRNIKHLKRKYKYWLETDFVIPKNAPNKQVKGLKRGRPRNPFEELGNKAKKIRVSETISSLAEVKMISEQASQMFQRSDTQTLSAQKALVLYLDLSLLVRKYNVMRSSINGVHKDCVPSITTVNKTKKSHLLQKTKITEVSAELDLQELLNKTSESILKICDQKDFISVVEDLKLVCKWDFDGSSGHIPYKQAFAGENVTDEHVFFIAFSPLKLLEKNKVVWSNRRPSSQLFCRPIKFLFVKESTEIVRREERDMIDKINNLKPYTYQYNNTKIRISFEMLLTMLDGSIGNILSDTNASARCFICKASPKEMNSEALLQKSFDDANLRFGMSTLHCWIRFLSVSFT